MVADRQAELAKIYLEEYLKSRGQTWEKVHELPPDQARQFMVEASTYAALKLAEVEARAHVVQGIHGVYDSV